MPGRVSSLLRLILLTLTAWTSVLSLAGEESGPLTPAQIRNIEDAISAKMSSGSIPGLSIAIALNRKLAWSRGFGLADIENFVPAKPSTIYRLASISKPITATAVMQLAEHGKLSLDTPARQFCPAFPEKQWPVTVRMLLLHQAGVRHYKGLAEINSTRHYPSLTEGLTIFKDDPLLFEPGTRFSYTSYGYNLLGCVIEGASGTSYPEYIARNVFELSGMSTARVDDVSEVIQNRARGYVIRDKKLQNAHLVDTSYKVPSGGWCSSVEDLASFGIALLNRKLLPDSALQQMWTAKDPSDGKPSYYGLGWQVRDRNGVREVFHTGGQQGTSTILLMVPEKDMIIAIMTNLEAAQPSSLARQVSDILLQPSK